MRMTNESYQWRLGVQNGIPIALGYVAVSFSFGLMARNQLTLFQAVAMSGTNYTSAGQFAALELIASGASYVEMFLVQLILNLRYSLMSCSLSQKLGSNYSFFHRLFIACGLTDEVFGVSTNQQGKISPYFIYGVLTMALPSWILGTALGVLLGNVIPIQLMNALNLALYSMFIAIIIPQAKKDKIIAGIILVSMLCSFGFEQLTFLHSVTSGVKTVGLTLIIAIGAAVFFPVHESNNI